MFKLPSEMTEDERLLLEEICKKYPYGLWVEDSKGNMYKVTGLIGQDMFYLSYMQQPFKISEFKPVLFPLEIVFDEGCEEIMVHGEKFNLYKKWSERNVRSTDFFDMYFIDHRGLIRKGLGVSALEKRKDIYF